MHHLTRLLDIMSDLRNPDSGCPWDLKQDYKSLVPYTLEEAYEVAEAIELGDMDEVKKELGDLLFQVVFYAQLAKEEGVFDFNDIAGAIADKMVSRHPHVFSDHHYENEEAFLKAWEQQKEQEKKQTNDKKSSNDEIQNPLQSLTGEQAPSLMDGISKAIPAMTRALKIQKKMSHVGFDWDHAEELLPVIKEELEELEIEMRTFEHQSLEEVSIAKDAEPRNYKDRVEEELGDVLFSCVNLSRKLNIDPEKALRLSNHKFSQRFRKMEQHYQHDRTRMEAAPLEELERLWQAAKER